MAAEWKKNKLVAAVLVGIIIICLWIIISMVIPKKYYYEANLVCEPCGPASLSVKKISGAQEFPMRCSVCRKMTVNRAMKCFDCDYIYAIKPIDDPVAMEIGPGLMIQKCPECDSLNVGVPPGPVLPR